VNIKNYCIAFNTYPEALEIIKICKENKIKPTIFIKYYLINGFGIDWLIELKNLLYKDFKYVDFKTYADAKNNYGLFLNLVENKINYIKVKANKEMFKRLSNIATTNKVLINPNFSIVERSKFKKLIENK
tara:strand:- start:106 stop:495 length:390 start_codon:yes stop_codon:yes gene_type:complete